MKDFLALKIGDQELKPPGGIKGGVRDWNINDIISVVISGLFLVATLFAVAMLIWAGVDWTMSKGDKQKIQNAKNKLVYSIVGLVVVFLSFLIISYVGKFFGMTWFTQSP